MLDLMQASQVSLLAATSELTFGADATGASVASVGHPGPKPVQVYRVQSS